MVQSGVVIGRVSRAGLANKCNGVESRGAEEAKEWKR